VGGGLYEFLVVDPFWPKRPDLVQPSAAAFPQGFWIAAHIAFEGHAGRVAGMVLGRSLSSVGPAGGTGESCHHAPLVGVRLIPRRSASSAPNRGKVSRGGGAGLESGAAGCACRSTS